MGGIASGRTLERLEFTTISVGQWENKPESEDELRPEYDEPVLQNGVRGKYVERDQAGTNVVVLDPDVAQAFPTAQSVNNALRLLLNIAQKTVSQPA